VAPLPQKRNPALAFFARPARIVHAVNAHRLLHCAKEAGRHSFLLRISPAQIFSRCVLLTSRVLERQTPGIRLACRDYSLLFAYESRFYFAHCRTFETLHCEKSFSSITQGGRKLSQCFVNQFRFCTEWPPCKIDVTARPADWTWSFVIALTVCTRRYVHYSVST
jgi:hypothetical protein